MRYRIYKGDPFTGWLDLEADDDDTSHRPLVHVFRDDELDEVVGAAIEAGWIATRDDVDGFLVAEYLRNHTSERQPGSADGAG